MEMENVQTENGHVRRRVYNFTDINRVKVGRVAKAQEPLTVLVSRTKENAERLSDYYISFRIGSALLEGLGWRAGDRVTIGFDKDHGVGRIKLSDDGKGYKLFGKDRVLRVRLTLGIDVPHFMPEPAGSASLKILDKTMKSIIFKLPKDMYFSSH